MRNAIKVKIAHVEIQTLVHATEEFEKVLICLKNIIPFDFEYETQKTFGHFKNPIIIIKVKLKKKAFEFFNSVAKNLSPEDKNRLSQQLKERFEEGKLYLRIDKMKAYAGEVALGWGIHIAFTVTSYPFNKQKIIEELRGKF